jgi:hypothetical protein
MAKLTQKQKDNRVAKMRDKTLSLDERKAAHRELMHSMLNPKDDDDFDPETFDPMDTVEDYEVKKRVRKEPSRRLPTRGLKPKEIYDGQMVGMFESKQDLYLLIAWLSHRVSDLEDEIERLRGG